MSEKLEFSINNNKLIALFMGGKTSDMNNKLVQGYQNIWLPIHGICNWTTIEVGHGKILQYHKSWDWLMPVIIKIGTIKIPFEDFNQHETYYPRTFGMINIENGNYLFRYNNLFLHESPELIKAAYAATVEFINYYNNGFNHK